MSFLGGGYPSPVTGRAQSPVPGPAWVCVGGGLPSILSGEGVPKSGQGVHPHSQTGSAPRTGQGYASCSHAGGISFFNAASGTPLAVVREDFLVLFLLSIQFRNVFK